MPLEIFKCISIAQGECICRSWDLWYHGLLNPTWQLFVPELPLPWELYSRVLSHKNVPLLPMRVMIHQPWGCSGQASDIEITAREILKLKDELYQIIAKHSGQTVEKVHDDSDVIIGCVPRSQSLRNGRWSTAVKRQSIASNSWVIPT